MPKLKLIQILRGFAALVVVLLHVNQSTKFYLNINWLNGIFIGGWFGVDFFFVLSGFIMVYIHHKDLENRKNIISFFKKRFIRIFPVYWFIASIYLFFLFYTSKLVWSNDYIYIIKSYLLLPSSISPFLGVAWSLVYECFFYFIFGLGLFLGLKIMKYILITWLILIIVFSFFTSQSNPTFIFNNFILEFLFGCIVGYHFVYNKNKFSNKPKIFIFSGLIILVCMYIFTLFTEFAIKSSIESRFGYGIASALIIFGAANFNSIKDNKINNILLKFGDASYTLYLIHPIVLGIAYKSTSFYFKNHLNFVNLFGFFVLLIVIIISVFFHIYVEKKVILFFSNLLSIKKNKSTLQ